MPASLQCKNHFFRGSTSVKFARASRRVALALKFCPSAGRLFQKRRASARKLAPKVEHADRYSSRECQSVSGACVNCRRCQVPRESLYVRHRGCMHICIFWFRTPWRSTAPLLCAKLCAHHQFLIKALGASNILAAFIICDVTPPDSAVGH